MTQTLPPSLANNRGALLIKQKQYETAIVELTNAFQVSKQLMLTAHAQRTQTVQEGDQDGSNASSDSSPIMCLPSMSASIDIDPSNNTSISNTSRIDGSSSSYLYTDPIYILNEPQSYLGIILMLRIILFNLALCYQLQSNIVRSAHVKEWSWLSKAIDLYHYSLELKSAVPTAQGQNEDACKFLWMASMNNMGQGLMVRGDSRSQDCYSCLYQMILNCDGWDESPLYRYFFQRANFSLSLFNTSRCPLGKVGPHSIAPAA